jgi:putative transposase
MARKPRLFVASVPYHVIQRGNNKNPIFLSDEDYLFFLVVLREAKIKHPCLIYSYCLMPNHFHLLLEPQEKENVSLFMKFTGAKYVHYFNRLYQRSGTLWEGRFRSSLIDKETYFVTCSSYIEMNPVRAGIVSSPELYRWSSYRIKAFGGKSPIVDFDSWYNSIGSDTEERQYKYRKFFQDTTTEETMQLIRKMTNKNGLIGSIGFKQDIEALLNKELTFAEPGRPRGQKK